MALTANLARRIIQAATEKAQSLGIPVSIAVIDAGTHLKAFSRLDGAVLGSIDLAIRKANTAALFEIDSEAVWDYAKPGAPAEGLQFSNGILATFAGGIPLRSASGEMLGAIGVSGGAVHQDREVAAAGAAALLERKGSSMSKTILITGAGSGFGEGTAIGLAQKGHQVIATVQISPHVTPLREKAAALGLPNLIVEKLDLLDPYDVAHALRWDIDILFNNAGIGEAGPVSEIPIELVRSNFETNVFAPLVLTQGFVKKWVAAKKQAKIVFMSSMGGLFTPPGFGAYVSTKHALEAIAEAMHQELRPFGIKVQTINPGAYLTGFNETMAETPFRWLDDSKNFTKRATMRAVFDSLLGTPEGRLDPAEAIEKMIEIIPAETGKFRNVIPQFVEDMLKEHQQEAWDAEM